MNDSTTSTTARKKAARPRTAWELSELIRPLSGNRARTTPAKNRRVLAYYPQVVLYVFRSRFATAYQIARRFPQQLASERTAHRRLAHLVELGHLAIASVRSTAPYFPNVYLATGKGVRWIQQLAAERGLTFTVSPAEERKERGRALDSVLHELLLTELELAVHQSVGNRADLSLPMTERRYFRSTRRLTYAHQGRTQHLIPDAGFLLGVATGQGSATTSHNVSQAFLLQLVEMDNGTMSLPRVLDKLRCYDLWSRSDAGQQYLTELYRRHGASHPQPNFRLLVVCHDKSGTHRGGDERRMLDVFIQALELPTKMQERIWMSTAERLRGRQDSASPLEAAVWIRVRDARPWLHEYRSFVASLPKGQGQKPYHRQRDYVASRIEAFSPHPIFPYPT